MTKPSLRSRHMEVCQPSSQTTHRQSEYCMHVHEPVRSSFDLNTCDFASLVRAPPITKTETQFLTNQNSRLLLSQFSKFGIKVYHYIVYKG